MKLQDLFETPQETFPTDFGLDDPIINFNTANQYSVDDRKIPLQKFDNGRYTLFEYPRAFALIDYSGETAKLSYIMKYKIAFHKFIGRKCAQQIAVWRDTKEPFTINLAKNIFFNHLLQNWKTVITDSMQTSDGQRFWDIRIIEALQMNYYVYYINLLPVREIIQIKSASEYRKLAANKEIWGNDPKHQARRIIITIESLPEAE